MPNNNGTQAVADEMQVTYKKVVQRVPVRIDFDRPHGQRFNVEGLLKLGLSVKPKVRVR